ncbi:MAG: hypothetical protein HY865_09515 [Chloroflexi bacterium]|nr:hypothetical protein [Chloroflexota bacterium]
MRTDSDLSLAVLRRQMAQLKMVNQNIHNLARSIFKEGVKVQYTVNAREYFGRVVEVIGEPGHTQVRVINIVTNRKRDLLVADITGLVQEN